MVSFLELLWQEAKGEGCHGSSRWGLTASWAPKLLQEVWEQLSSLLLRLDGKQPRQTRQDPADITRKDLAVISMDQSLGLRQDHASQRPAAQACHKGPGTETESEVAPARRPAEGCRLRFPEEGAACERHEHLWQSSSACNPPGVVLKCTH